MIAIIQRAWPDTKIPFPRHFIEHFSILLFLFSCVAGRLHETNPEYSTWSCEFHRSSAVRGCVRVFVSWKFHEIIILSVLVELFSVFALPDFAHHVDQMTEIDVVQANWLLNIRSDLCASIYTVWFLLLCCVPGPIVASIMCLTLGA